MNKLHNLHLLLPLLLILGCGPKSGGGNNNNNNNNNLNVAINGNLIFEEVPAQGAGRALGGLDYDNIQNTAISKAKVQLLDENNNILGQTNADDNGSYNFNDIAIAENSNVKIRVFAQVINPPIRVQDNTQQNAIHVLDSDLVAVDGDLNIDLTAETGFDGNSYSGERAAAPFNILHDVLVATEFVLDARPLNIPLSVLNWSEDNSTVSGDVSLGEIGTSFFDFTINQIFILGEEDVDTDEFDSDVIVHEWGHFLEENISRSDSLGGNHSGGDIIDPTVAFSEGYAQALPGMVFFPDAIFTDSGDLQQDDGILVQDLEDNIGEDINPGWFSESSVTAILYDIFDNIDDNADVLNLGIGPILDVLADDQKNADSLTTIFGFLNGLKNKNAGVVGDIDALANLHEIDPVVDEFGTGDDNDGGFAANLPVYRDLVIGGGATTVNFDNIINANNLAASNRLFKFIGDGNLLDVTTISVEDVDIFVFEKGVLLVQAFNVGGNETATFQSEAGVTYIARISDDNGVAVAHDCDVAVAISARKFAKRKRSKKKNKKYPQKQVAPVLIKTQTNSKSSVINVTFPTNAKSVSIDVYGVKGLEVYGRKTRILGNNFLKGGTYKEEIFHLPTLPGSRLVVSVKGKFNGRTMRRIQSFTVTPRIISQEVKRNVVIDSEGKRLHIKKAKTVVNKNND